MTKRLDYAFGEKRAPLRPIKARTAGIVKTAGSVMFDRVRLDSSGRYTFGFADATSPATDVRVVQIMRSSDKPTEPKARVHKIYAISVEGIHLACARSLADVQRKLGVELPKVRACTRP